MAKWWMWIFRLSEMEKQQNASSADFYGVMAVSHARLLQTNYGAMELHTENLCPRSFMTQASTPITGQSNLMSRFECENE
ncbi:MAG: hypothetical protein ACI9GW_003092 [Halieaceae bacterium]|jgi:hypothetical protein